jgi:hypothetical protein
MIELNEEELNGTDNFKKKKESEMVDEEEDLAAKEKESKEDLQWPDEVITPRDQPARIRFQK